MNVLTKPYRDKYGSIEPYLVIKMEIAIILALLITLSTIFVQQETFLLNILTAAIVIHSSYQVKKNFPEKAKKYIGVFIPMYILALVTPFILTQYTFKLSTIGMELILISLALLVTAMILFKEIISRKGVKAKVLLADSETAVIRPEYDFLSGIKPSKYAVENNVGAKKGDRVKVKVSKTLFSQPRPNEVVKVIKGGKR